MGIHRAVEFSQIIVEPQYMAHVARDGSCGALAYFAAQTNIDGALRARDGDGERLSTIEIENAGDRQGLWVNLKGRQFCPTVTESCALETEGACSLNPDLDREQFSRSCSEIENE